MSAQGEDRSNFQRVTSWAGQDFGFCKATEGLTFTDATFGPNWAELRKEGKPRGAYHFFHPGLDPIAQAAFFVGVVKAHGLNPGDMLVADVEILAGSRPLQWAKQLAGHRLANQNTRMKAVPLSSVNSAAKRFLDAVAALAGPVNPVLVYTNLSVGSTLSSCTGYDLWIAFPSAKAPLSVAPWKTWRFWQWGIVSGTDRDAYNGSVTEMKNWLKKFTDPPKPPSKPRRFEADGKLTFRRAAHNHGMTVQRMLWLTEQNAGHGNGDLQAAYFDAGSWNSPMPKGMVYWAGPTP